MGKPKFSEDFKQDAVHPLPGSGLPANHEKEIVVRGYPVREVSERLGVSTHSLYAWMKKFSPAANNKADDAQSEEIRRLKRELIRVTEERNILKKATAYFAKDVK